VDYTDRTENQTVTYFVNQAEKGSKLWELC